MSTDDFQESLQDAFKTHATLMGTVPKELYRRLSVVQHVLAEHPPPKCPEAQLFIKAEVLEAWVPLHDGFVVGSSPESDFSAPYRFVSRRHCRFVQEDGGNGWDVEDLDSRNGTYVNGVKTPREELKDGDILQIGSVTAIFLDGDGACRLSPGLLDESAAEDPLLGELRD